MVTQLFRNIFASGTLILALSSLISRLLGLLRDKLFAYKFGALGGTGVFDIDAYYAAFRIPDFIFQLLILGTVSAAFVPMFSDYFYGNEKSRAWKFLNTTLSCLTLLTLIIASAMFILAPWIIPLIVPGFLPDKMDLTIHLTRIMLVSPIFFCISSIFQSVENATKKYAHFALAPIVYNLSIITAALIFADTYGVIAISYGVIIGAALHAIVQLPAIKNLGYHFALNLDFRSRDFRNFIRLVIPRILAIGITQFNILVDTIIASTLMTGSLASLNYALNIQSLPLGLIGVSISIVAFGIFSEQISKKDITGAIETLREKLETISIYIIPATIGLLILSRPLVETLLQGGNFTQQDTELTSSLLGILALGLLAQSILPLLTRFLYAKKNTRTPVAMSIMGFIINIMASLFFARHLDWGVLGIGTGLILSSILQAILLVWYIEHSERIQIFNQKELKKYQKILIATTGMGIIVWLLQPLVTIIISALIGVATYFFLLKKLNYPEVKKFLVPLQVTRKKKILP